MALSAIDFAKQWGSQPEKTSLSSAESDAGISTSTKGVSAVDFAKQWGQKKTPENTTPTPASTAPPITERGPRISMIKEKAPPQETIRQATPQEVANANNPERQAQVRQVLEQTPEAKMQNSFTQQDPLLSGFGTKTIPKM